MILAMMLALALPQDAQDAGKARRPTAAGDPTSWVTDDDYPVVALRRNEQGIVGLQLSIDAAGKVIGCKITSTVSAVLDQASCALMTERGRFNPALDETGKPTAGTYNTRFTWALPEPKLVPLGSWHSLAVVQFDAAGTPTSCAPEKFGIGRDRPGNQCGAFAVGVPDKFLPNMVGMEGKPFIAVAENAIVLEGDPAPDFRYAKPGHRLVALTRTRFEVSETGAVENCSPIPTGKEDWLAQLSDLCASPGGVFEPKRDADGASLRAFGTFWLAISVLQP